MTDVLMCARNVKLINNSILTVLGGHHIYSYPEESIEYDHIDYILQGEADFSFCELLNAVEKNQTPEEIVKIDGIGFKRNGHPYFNPKVSFIHDLDSLPVPDRSLLPEVKYSSVFNSDDQEISIISSRGCPFNCSFCFSPEKNYRSRSNEHILSEIKLLYRQGHRNFFFFDDLFSLNVNKIRDISELFIQEGLNLSWSYRGRIGSVTDESVTIARKSGLKRIQFGIESFNQDVLDACGKHNRVEDIYSAIRICKKHKVTAVGNLMIGLPGQTKDVVLSDIRASKRSGLDFVEYNLYTPLPHTRVYNEAIEKKIIPFDFWRKFARDPINEHGNFRMYYYENELSAEQQFQLCRYAFRSFYLRPKFILARLLSIRSFAELKDHITGACKLLLFNPESHE